MPVPYTVATSGKIITEYTESSNVPKKTVPVQKGSITVPKLKFGKNEEEESPAIQSAE